MGDLEARARQLYREIEATDQRDAEEMIRRALEEVVEACAVEAEASYMFSGAPRGPRAQAVRRQAAAAIRALKR